jgi:hypothetical protein
LDLLDAGTAFWPKDPGTIVLHVGNEELPTSWVPRQTIGPIPYVQFMDCLMGGRVDHEDLAGTSGRCKDHTFILHVQHTTRLRTPRYRGQVRTSHTVEDLDGTRSGVSDKDLSGFEHHVAVVESAWLVWGYVDESLKLEDHADSSFGLAFLPVYCR